MITVLSGTNMFQRNDMLNKIVGGFIKEHSSLALEKIDATEVEYNIIIGAVESLPFLADKKMVVLYDLSLNKHAAENLEKLIELSGETTDLIIVETKLDKRSSYYKSLKKLENFHDFNEMDEQKLVHWLTDQAKSIKANLSNSDASYLVQRVGADQLRLSNELTKLAQFNSQISRQSINNLTTENPSSTIFNLIDSIFSGNPQRALKIYEEQRQLRVEPQAIHGMLVWQMHAVAIAVSAPNSVSHTQMAKDSGISPFVMQKSQRIAQAMGRTKVVQFIKLLRDFDYRSKHEVFDYDEALKYAILSLAK